MRYLKILADAFGEAAIWKPYRISVENGFVFLDEEKVVANPEIERLLKTQYPHIQAGDKPFNRPVPIEKPKSTIIPPWIKQREVKCIACGHCRKDNRGQLYCELVELKYPGKSLIYNGIRRIDTKCPDDPSQWGKVSEQEIADFRLMIAKIIARHTRRNA